MIRNMDGTEKLYLSKKSHEIIYIDNCKIPQHHLDGVRFLYRQYKKKKPGVIINETTGFNRNLQTVLFVKAMCHIFKQPLLVLCQEGAEHGWMEQFQTWTDLCDDVVLETRKPHIKKQVLINTMANLSAFSNRNWSVLVVDSPETDKATLQALERFRADYKIWITPVNIRENLDHFSIIYKWLYPKEKFDKSNFISSTNNLKDVIDKAILLDAFLEDIVARNEEDHVENKQNNESPRKRISLKNKDATGTKIKRSKRKIYDDDDIETNNTAPIQNTVLDNQEFNEDFSIDNFKRKRKELHKNVINDTGELETEESESVKMNTLNSQSEVNLFYEPDSSTEINNDNDKLYEMDTIVYGNDTCDERNANVNETVNEIIDANEDSYLGQKDEGCDETNVSADDETPSDCDGETLKEGKLYVSNDDISMKSPSSIQVELENNEISQEIDDNDEIEPENDKSMKSPSTIQVELENNEISQEIDDNDEIEPDNDKSMKSPSTIQVELENNEISQEIDDNDEIEPENDKTIKSPSTIQVELENNEISKEINDNDEIEPENEVHLEMKSPNHTNNVCDKLKSSDNNIFIPNEVIESNGSIDNDEKSSVINDKAVSVSNTLKHQCIDDKLKELEEKVMKRFKGSILDSLI